MIRGSGANRVRGYPVLGGFEKLSQLITSGAVDEVVLSIRSIDPSRVRTLEALCEAESVQLSRLTVGLQPLTQPDRAIARPPARTVGR